MIAAVVFISAAVGMAAYFLSDKAEQPVNQPTEQPAEKPLSAAELLDLGEKYLLEMNYEQAIICFTQLIEVEPMNPRGYTGSAEAYMRLDETEKAIIVLQDGLRLIPGNADIQAMLDEIQQPEAVETLSPKEIAEKEP